MSAQRFLTPSWQAVTFLEPEQAAGLDEELAGAGLYVATVDARDLLTHDGLLATLGSTFGFPDYYGHNYNALNECLRDLSWLAARGYVLRVLDAERLWRTAPIVGGALVQTWLFCAEYWSAQQAGFHRQPPPTPFHLLMVW